MMSVIHAVVDGVSQRYQVSKFTLCVKIPGQLDIQILQTVGGCVNTGEIRNNFQHQLRSRSLSKITPALHNCLSSKRQIQTVLKILDEHFCFQNICLPKNSHLSTDC